MAARILALFSLAIALPALSGCADDAPAAAPEAAPGLGGEGAAVALLDANASVAAPRWAVGQWWEWQIRFGAEVAQETFCSIVVAAGGNPVLATEKDPQAKHEATFGHPLLGEVGAGLAMTGFGGEWDLLDFPLADGKAWTATLPNVAWDVLPPGPVQLAMTAAFDPDLQGFRLMGHVEQGMLLEATYLPATGWFGELLLYDVDPGEEELEFGFVAVNTGLDYAGPYFRHEARLALELFDGNGFDNDPTQGGQPFVQPEPHGTFTMDEGTMLFGVVEAFTVLGGRVVTLTDPAGNQRQVVSQGDLDGDGQGIFLDEPGVAGQWTVATGGAGGHSGGFVQLYEITPGGSTL